MLCALLFKFSSAPWPSHTGPIFQFCPNFSKALNSILLNQVECKNPDWTIYNFCKSPVCNRAVNSGGLARRDLHMISIAQGVQSRQLWSWCALGTTWLNNGLHDFRPKLRFRTLIMGPKHVLALRAPFQVFVLCNHLPISSIGIVLCHDFCSKTAAEFHIFSHHGLLVDLSSLG